MSEGLIFFIHLKMKYFKIPIFIFAFSLITPVFCQNGKGAAYKNYTNSNNDISNVILEQEMLNLMHDVTKKGVKVKEINNDVLESNWIDRVRLYRLGSQYYVIASLKTELGFKNYIYCNITPASWNDFVQTNHLTYGQSFNLYIHPKKCF